MMKRRATARKVSSFVAPTEDDLAYFKSLSPDEQRALLRVEIDKGFAGRLTDRTSSKIVSKASKTGRRK